MEREEGKKSKREIGRERQGERGRGEGERDSKECAKNTLKKVAHITHVADNKVKKIFEECLHYIWMSVDSKQLAMTQQVFEFKC